MSDISAPIFDFGNSRPVTLGDPYLQGPVPRGELRLAGPSACDDRTRLPLRGDLAHIKLAGRCFVPHYAVPMAHVVTAAGAVLRAAGNADAAPLAKLAPGVRFEVLDIAGAFAWGQLDDGLGGDGLVGYIALSTLTPA